ncbi:hypothetical protein TUM19329_24870 [Legionella antarctica]|uniref:Uncharacterized protein n=1 Tax=Legionella antarctica TaxID=2708020 RepID=A0A6F8T834_9GAMM|nr:hypothetical protein [Legionella antarctica]BCA96126.1 hypothetical protein TUM19329_24870 [Legionella antarctica]
MLNTTSALLVNLNMKHDHIKDSPILNIPMFLFKETQYADLLLILWLYEQKWIDDSKIPEPGVVMGEVSHKHVTVFCSEIKKEAYQAIARLNDVNSESRKSFTITSKPNIWVNPTQVTHYISNNPVFKLVTELMTDSSECANELIFFLSWIEHISALDKTKVVSDWECLKKTGNYKFNMLKLVLALTQTEPFKSHPNPPSLVYKFLGEIGKRQSNPIYTGQVN